MSAPPVDDQALTDARTKAEAASARLREAERADPLSASWPAEFEAAQAAARAAFRRVEALEAARAAQVERSGARADAVRAASKDLASTAKALAASRDAVANAAGAHLKTLTALASAERAHNELLGQSRATLAATGLRVRDDLSEGQEHSEGVLDSGGVRAGNIDWTSLPAGAVAAHALRLVYGGCGPLHPLSSIGRYVWRVHEVEGRPDGLRMPSLADAGASLPEAPPRAVARSAPLSDVIPAKEPAPRRGRTAI